MHSGVQIGPVPRRRRGRALAFLATGRRRGPSSEVRGAAMSEILETRASGAVHLWWARRRRRCVAVAAVIESDGNVGFLFHSPATGAGVDPHALAQVIQAASAAAMATPLAFVQVLVLPSAVEAIAVLRLAGFTLLAELVFMIQALPGAAMSDHDEPADLRWRHYGQFNDQELSELIFKTYEGSLDCPALIGVRRPEDVIAGHKASGIFCGRSWWVMDCDGSPAACILVNSAATSQQSELVYMGVVPSHRGKGLASVLLHHAAGQAHAEGHTAITLAVDANNAHARRVYDAVGFVETERRLAYARVAGPQAGRTEQD